MRSTLFYIPHEILGLPLLGWGWLLILIALGFLGWTWSQYRAGRLKDEWSSGLPMWLVASGLVAFILPMVESRWPDGEPIGLPVRGYGVLVLIGLFAGIGLTVWRGKQVGVSADRIMSLGFWMMLGGVAGARIFYVVQYWENFDYLPLPSRIISMLMLTEGGLVIYGGMIGGVISGALFCMRWRMPMLAMADLITPGFLIGLAFGRLGCLMNGCCFGGVCEASLPTIQFPQGSLPYVAQVENGRLFGLTVNAAGDTPVVSMVKPETFASKQLKAEPGMTYEETHRSLLPERGRDDPARAPAMVVSVAVGSHSIVLEPEQLPAWSQPVHPSQIYSAIDAFLLCLLILMLQTWVLRDGQAFLAAIAFHGVARFTLELIRSDEAGQFGTSLTIAQWISLIGGIAAMACLLGTLRMPKHRAWTWR